MLKLQELKKKQQQQQQQQTTKTETQAPATTEQTQQTSSEENNNTEGSGSTGYILKRQNSKELAEKRRQKSKENVFTLRRSGGVQKDKKKKQNAAELRVHKDLSEMDPIPGTRLDFPDPNNLMTFNLFVTPTDGLYKGAEFKFVITIPQTYPYDPPKAHCETPIYHPNIDWEGHVCLNILRADWMPVLNIGAVVFGIVTLFLQPNPDDPLNKEVAQLMLDNRSQFERNVKQTLQGGSVSGRQFPKLLK
eukprot:CAMPEP_0168547432 /NCGR_PEP_ID=MMETSP0413-20121227/4032_1 /TAXON_ID=136452 /ORGANISM="Filamoeba nolandi, Strain NC-AS-23-1" /LENGTH=247 /DNA_ID=CAMNT_0008577683 /DNA_START=130 /DNA_END=873 /DNA_ORIENTATION=+